MSDEGLIHACILDGKGGARQVGWESVERWTPEHGPMWIHLDYTAERARQWIVERSRVDEFAARALLSEETRPRVASLGDATLVLLRGVNLNPGSDPEDMVSVRMWVEKNRVISCRRRMLMSVQDMVEAFSGQTGPRNTGAFVAHFIGHLTTRMDGAIIDLEDRASQVEEEVFSGDNDDLRGQLAAIRRETITLRRYLSPQREAMTRLYADEHDWIGHKDRLKLRETGDQLQRYIENLDAVRERAMVTHEELSNRLSEQMNSRIYLLSLVAALFLPLTFFTGLLGINVGGIPGSNNTSAFAIVVTILVGVIIAQLLYFKARRWF